MDQQDIGRHSGVHGLQLCDSPDDGDREKVKTVERRGQSRLITCLALTSQLSVRLDICHRVREKKHNFIKVLSRDHRGSISKEYIGQYQR